MRTSRAARLAAPLVAAALALAACGGSAGSTGGSGTGSADDLAAAKASASALVGGGGAPVDVCALLKPADVQAILGTTVEGSAQTAPGDAGGCMWENKENYYSVTIDVGAPGTAPGGVMPPDDPAYGTVTNLAGGMRGFSGGVVEFAADERVCHVQVSTLSSSDQQTAVGVANKVKAGL